MRLLIVREGENIKTFIKRSLFLLCILLLWSICAKKVNPLFIPDPKMVYKNFVEMFKSGQLFIAIKYSFTRITISTFLSGIISFPIALLIYNSQLANDFVSPIISIMRYIPVTAFYPLLIMWFGID